MNKAKRGFLTAAAGLAGNALLRSAAPWAAMALTIPAAANEISTGILSLEARAARAPLPGLVEAADVITLDGTIEGPVLRIRHGQSIALSLTNRLDEPIGLQWHGLRCPNAVDGAVGLTGPALAPDATSTIRFTPSDSGLSWFHAAALPGYSDQTARGLRGVLIVEEREPPLADRDLLVNIADWRLGQEQANTKQQGLLTVNVTALPEQVTLAPGARLRLRVVNTSTAKIIPAAITGARPFIIAIDGQPSELFEPVKDMVPIGPGACFDFMIDLPREPGALMQLTMRGGDADRVLLEVRTKGAARAPLPPIAALPGNPQLPPAIPLERSVRADLTMETAAAPAGQATWRLNGSATLDLPARPLLSVKQGGTVTLGFTNKSKEPIALRVHGHVMRLLHSKDDGWEPYWRNSVLLPPGTINHVAFVADNPGKWLIESAIFAQAATGLRHWFVVRG